MSISGKCLANPCRQVVCVDFTEFDLIIKKTDEFSGMKTAVSIE